MNTQYIGELYEKDSRSPTSFYIDETTFFLRKCSSFGNPLIILVNCPMILVSGYEFISSLLLIGVKQQDVLSTGNQQSNITTATWNFVRNVSKGT